MGQQRKARENDDEDDKAIPRIRRTRELWNEGEMVQGGEANAIYPSYLLSHAPVKLVKADFRRSLAPIGQHLWETNGLIVQYMYKMKQDEKNVNDSIDPTLMLHAFQKWCRA